MKPQYATYGFGFNPEESEHHFMVVIPKSKSAPVKVFERFLWHGEGDLTADCDERPNANILRVAVPRDIWDAAAPYLASEFNYRLKKEGLKTYKWKLGNNPLHRLYGKELVLLLWALEDEVDPSRVSLAVINWQGLRPEERWFLYGLASAATGRPGDHKKGWRMAIKYGLLENPVDPKAQPTLWDNL